MKKLLFVFGIWLTLDLTASAQFNAEPRKITDRFFPESNLVINTPAFQKKKGFTKYKEMMPWLMKAIEGKENLATLSYIGKSQNGRAIPMVILGKNYTTNPVKVWLQGGLHGDEAAGTEAMLHLIDRFLNDPELTALLDKVQIAIVPMVNPDGYNMHRRESANGTDLNRDHTKLSAPESKALKNAFSAFAPAVALDVHEYRPYRKDFSRFSERGISSYYDIMFLYSGNLNVPQPLRDFTKTAFVDPTKLLLDEKQIRHHDYITTQKYGGQVHFNQGSVHSRSSASAYALNNSISTLLEIRGVGIGRTNFKRRIESGYLVCLNYIRIAVARQTELQALLNSKQALIDKITVTSERKVYPDTIKAIDIATYKVINLPITVHDALKSVPTQTLERPFAYLILPTERRAIANLKAMGLTIDSLTSSKQLMVESYKITYKADGDDGDDVEDEPLAGDMNSTTEKIAIDFPEGTYVVYTNQRGGNLLCEVIEPDNQNGFVSTKVIANQAGVRLPIFRYTNTQRITQ